MVMSGRTPQNRHCWTKLTAWMNCAPWIWVRDQCCSRSPSRYGSGDANPAAANACAQRSASARYAGSRW